MGEGGLIPTEKPLSVPQGSRADGGNLMESMNIALQSEGDAHKQRPGVWGSLMLPCLRLSPPWLSSPAVGTPTRWDPCLVQTSPTAHGALAPSREEHGAGDSQLLPPPLQEGFATWLLKALARAHTHSQS